MVQDIAPKGDLELTRLRQMIVRHWRRAGWSIWSQADVDAAIERVLDIARHDPEVVREIIVTGIGGHAHGR